MPKMIRRDTRPPKEKGGGEIEIGGTKHKGSIGWVPLAMKTVLRSERPMLLRAKVMSQPRPIQLVRRGLYELVRPG